MLLALHHGSSLDDHTASIDGFFAGRTTGELLPAAVFVCQRPDEALAGFLELSIRNYAEGCEGAVPFVESWFVDPDVRESRYRQAAHERRRALGAQRRV